MNIRSILCAAALAAGAFPVPVVLAADKVLVFGIVPEQKPEELAKKWQPILDAVSKKAGVKIKMDVSQKDISSFYEKYYKGGYDIAFVNPYVYAAKTKPGLYKAFARQDAQLQGILVVSKASVFKGLTDLRGKRVALPSPESYGSSILNLLEFKNARLDPEKDVSISYLGNHDKVYAAVASGSVEAGGGIMRTFIQSKPEITDKLRILHTTTPSITHPFVVNGKVPQALELDIQKGFTELDSTPEGVALYRAVGMGKIIPAKDADYDSLRKPGS